MTPSKSLFELIKSLNKTEKGYFKKSAKIHTVGGRNSYLLLFDAIDKQKEYNEKKLIVKLAQHKFIVRLAFYKNYLYSRILDALENYHREISINTKLRSEMNRAELLISRGLYEHAEKIVEKTKRRAEGSELNHILLDVYFSLELSIHSEKFNFESLEALYDKAMPSIESYKRNLKSWEMSSKMLRCHNYYLQTRDNKYLNEVSRLVKDPFYKTSHPGKTFIEKIQFYETFLIYEYTKSNLRSAYMYGTKMLDLYRSNHIYLKNYPKKYFSVLNNLFVLSAELKNWDNAYVHLQQLSDGAGYAKMFFQKTIHFYFLSTDSLHYLYKTYNIIDLQKYLPGVISGFKTYANELGDSEKIELLAHCALSYYYLGNLKKCILFLNKLRNEYDLSKNPEVESLFYLFYLIVLYEAGNDHILASSVQTFYRFLKKKEYISKLELSIINFLRKLPQINTEKKLMEELKRFKNTLQAIKPGPWDKYIFKYIDLSVWLESKIENRSFAELMKERQGRRPNI